VGLLLQLIAFMCVVGHAPTLTDAPPAWTALVAACALFAYSTLDNMDGKQARKTGSSSPLGLLFDHGCDAVNAAMLGPWILAGLVQADFATWKPYALFVMTTLPFFVATWEEFHVGKFVLPVINGPSEGLMLAVSFFVCTWWFGTALWSHEHVLFGTLPTLLLRPVINVFLALAGMPTSDAPLTNVEVVIGATAVTAAATYVYNTINVVAHVLRQPGAMPYDAVKAIGACFDS
jgi:ethanolaminephosphotransferase